MKSKIHELIAKKIFCVSKKINLFTLLLFSISAFSQSWLPVGGGSYESCQFPCVFNTNADTDLALNNANQPYVFYANSIYGSDGGAVVKKFENNTWSNVGNTNFSIGCVEPSIAISNGGTPFVAYQNADFKAEARFLNGPTWQLLGISGFSPDLANGITIRVNSQNQPYVAYADGNQLGKMTVKKYNWNTSQWETVGTEGFSISRATYVDFEIASNDDLYVSYIDGDSSFGELQKLCVKKFDGTNWVSVGIDRFTSENIYYSSFALDNNNVPYVIYTDLDETLPKLSVQKFNGASWEYVGTPRFSSTETVECDITFDVNNKPNIVYKKPNYDNDGIYTHDSLSSMLYENDNWHFVGVENFSPWSSTVKPCIEIGSNNIAYISDEQAYFDENTNLIVGGYVSYFGTATTLVNPSLTSVSQSGIQCSDLNQQFELSGMQPNSTSTVEYSINGIPQPNSTNVTAYSNGIASLYINIPASNSGQTLTITKVIRTDITGTTDLICSVSTIVQSNANITYYQDSDGDGLGDPTQTYQSCEGQPLNYVTNYTDCDASNPNAFINTFSNPTPSVCAAGSPVLLSITNNSRPVSGTTGGCLNANYGQYPGNDFTPSNYDGVTPNIILTNGYAGEYSVVNIIPNTKYIFKSERFYNSFYGANSQNDRVTIGSIDGTTVLASGQHTAVWQSTVATQVRFYSHATRNYNNQNNIGPCGEESFSRTRSVICAPTNIVKPVVWSPVFGLFTDAAGTIPYTGQFTTEVYAKPNQNTTYSLTSASGCVQANAITVTISGQGTTYYQDADNDGFGNNAIAQLSCTQPIGYVLNNTDCDDANANATIPSITTTTISSCTNYTWSNTGIMYLSSGEYTGTTTNCVTEKLILTIIPSSNNNTTITSCGSYTWENNNQTYTQSGTYIGTTTNCVTEILSLTITPLTLNDTTVTACDTYTWFDGTVYNQSGEYFLLGNGCSISRLFLTINQSSVYYADSDNDGFGNPLIMLTDCISPSGYVLNNTDCDDTNPSVNPGATEIAYDGIDNNCDGHLDEGFPRLQTNLNLAVCGITLPFIYTSIATPYVPVSGITGYRFKAKNMTSGVEQTIDRGLFNWFRINQLSSYDFATTYEVSVELQRAGIWLGYYGSTCQVTTPGIPVINQCGQTLAAGSAITTTALTGVTQYTFQVTNVVAGSTQTFNKPSNILIVNQIPSYLATNVYLVRVAVKTANGSLSEFGTACTINPAPAARFGNSVNPSTGLVTEFKAVGAPNPFESNFTLSVTTASDAKVQIAVYDMIGKQLELKEVNATDATEIELGANYPSGVYNVVVSQGANVKSLRMIKR